MGRKRPARWPGLVQPPRRPGARVGDIFPTRFQMGRKRPARWPGLVQTSAPSGSPGWRYIPPVSFARPEAAASLGRLGSGPSLLTRSPGWRYIPPVSLAGRKRAVEIGAWGWSSPPLLSGGLNGMCSTACRGRAGPSPSCRLGGSLPAGRGAALFTPFPLLAQLAYSRADQTRGPLPAPRPAPATARRAGSLLLPTRAPGPENI